jgi:hypothetical protein
MSKKPVGCQFSVRDFASIRFFHSLDKLHVFCVSRTEYWKASHPLETVATFVYVFHDGCGQHSPVHGFVSILHSCPLFKR